MGNAKPYARTARVNQILREIIAEALEREVNRDERLNMVTITSVETSPDMRHARVFYSALGNDVTAALEDHRVHFQSIIATRVRMKRTPQLQFSIDPSLETGWRVEEIVRSWHEDDYKESGQTQDEQD